MISMGSWRLAGIALHLRIDVHVVIGRIFDEPSSEARLRRWRFAQ